MVLRVLSAILDPVVSRWVVPLPSSSVQLLLRVSSDCRLMAVIVCLFVVLFVQCL